MRAHRRDTTTGQTCPPSRQGLRVPRRELQSLSVGVLLLLSVCGCAPSATTHAGENAPSTATAPSRATTVVPETPAPHDQELTPSASATAGTAVLASAAMRSFCHPEWTQQAWLAGLDPYLTLAAASAYATVQPSRVTCTRVTAAALLEEGDDFTRLVTVQTDAGLYRVTVTRASATERWLVFRIAPVTAQ